MSNFYIEIEYAVSYFCKYKKILVLAYHFSLSYMLNLINSLLTPIKQQYFIAKSANIFLIAENLRHYIS
jgi:hypothetical protein